jgi:hypothetical protein
MEFIEVEFTSIVNYLNFLENNILSKFNISREREEILKIFLVCRKLINFLSEKLEIKEINQIFNEIYEVLRKIHISLSLYLNGSYIDLEKNLKNFKNCCNRNEMYLKSLLEDLNEYKSGNKILSNKDSVDILKKTKFLIKATFGNISNSTENIFLNLSQYKDEVYYIKTNDIFEFFYFFRTNEGRWYWSPPKKTDIEDVWILAPEIKIDKGYWTDKKIPTYIEDFIIWLDIIKPNIPQFYQKKNPMLTVENDPEGKYEKLNDNIDKLEEQMSKKNCIIF